MKLPWPSRYKGTACGTKGDGPLVRGLKRASSPHPARAKEGNGKNEIGLPERRCDCTSGRRHNPEKKIIRARHKKNRKSATKERKFRMQVGVKDEQSTRARSRRLNSITVQEHGPRGTFPSRRVVERLKKGGGIRKTGISPSYGMYRGGGGGGGGGWGVGGGVFGFWGEGWNAQCR